MNNVSHFAVRADDLERAKQFYGAVFGWTFEPWGPPDFYLIQTGAGTDAIPGALHRREVPLEGEGICTFECTIAVADVDQVAHDVVQYGGTIVYEKSVIPGVGEVIRFKDTESNFVSAMRYESTV